MDQLIDGPPYSGKAKSHFLRASLRVLIYSIAALILTIKDLTIHGVSTANMASFVLFSAVFELMFVPTGSPSRRWCYMVCLLGLVVAGGFLIREASSMEIQAHAAKAACVK